MHTARLLCGGSSRSDAAVTSQPDGDVEHGVTSVFLGFSKS
jgi:hypothetical protein